MSSFASRKIGLSGIIREDGTIVTEKDQIINELSNYWSEKLRSYECDEDLADFIIDDYSKTFPTTNWKLSFEEFREFGLGATPRLAPTAFPTPRGRTSPTSS